MIRPLSIPVRAALVAALVLLFATGVLARTVETTDGAVADAVASELAQDDAVMAHRIDVLVESGVVTLEGVVSDLLAKERAVKLARTVRGVRTVIDALTVGDTFAVPDDKLRQDVLDAMAADPAVEPMDIGVGVDDARVRLIGSVASWQERELAAKVAKGVRGVQALENELRINRAKPRSDMEIAEEVRRALAWDALVEAGGLSVRVEEGTVELSGVVGSAAERARALRDAWVAGVEAVEAAKLAVDPKERDRMQKERLPKAVADEDISQAVREAIYLDPRINSERVEVEANEGVVTLRGKVSHLGARRNAEAIARNTVGVWAVDNLLRVVSPDPPDDETVARQVEQALARHPRIDAKGIDVHVSDARVRLSGAVETLYARQKAAELASRVNGVVEVVDNLSLPPAKTDRSDREIERAVERELFWDPYVDSDQIVVEVEGGRAVLTGTVRTWLVRERAQQNARQAGAAAVVNRVDVAPGRSYYDPVLDMEMSGS